MAQKEVLIKINVDDKSLNQLTGDVKALGGEIQKVENIGAGLNIDQKFKAAQGSIKAFAGSVEAAVGAIGLLGIESKVFDEYERYALSVLSFGRGIFDLTEGIEDLRKSGALANTMLKAQDALNKVTTVSARALGIATNTTSTAFKNLKAAIASTGIGLLVVAIGYAVQKMIEFADANKEAKQAADDFNESLKESKELLTEETAALTENLETRLLLLEESGASEKQLEEARREYHQDLLTRYREAEDEAYKAIDVAKTLGKEQEKAARESLENIQKARAKAETDENQRRIRQRITVANQAKDDAKKAKEDAIKFAQEKGDLEAQLLQETAITREDFQFAELEATNQKYDKLVSAAQKYGLSTVGIENKRQLELTKLFQRFDREDKDRADKRYTSLSNLQNETIASYIRTLELEGEEEISILEQNFALRLRELTTQEQVEKESNRLRYEQGLIDEEEYQATKSGIIEKYEQINKEAIAQNNEDIKALRLSQIDNEYYIAAQQIDAYYMAFDAFQQISHEKSLISQAGFYAEQALRLLDLKETAWAALRKIAINNAEAGSDVAKGFTATLKAGFPQNVPLLIAYAAQAAAIVASMVNATKKAKSAVESGSSPSITAPSAPSTPQQSINASLFDLQALPQGQLAPVPGGVKQQPIRAYVLAGDVSSAQEADAKLNLKRTVN